MTGLVITRHEASRATLLRAVPTAVAALLGGAGAQALLGPGGVLPVIVTGAGGLALAVAAERAAKAKVRIGPRFVTETALAFVGGLVVIVIARWLS